MGRHVREMRILIIEDVDAMRSLLRTLVSNLSGFQVSGTASTITEGRLEVDRHRPDLVLLDELLPGEASLDFLAELEQEQIPVLLISSMESWAERPLPRWVRGRIAKPSWDGSNRDLENFGKALEKALK